MRRWELPVFCLASVAFWIGSGCYRFTISKGEGHRYSVCIFDSYLTGRDSWPLIGWHVAVSLVAGLLAWALGLGVQAIADRRRSA